MMRPFFSYYGSRWNIAKRYPAPPSQTVVEPFAGSAGYSVYYSPRKAMLYDLSEDIIAIWQWLIDADPDDVLNLPDPDTEEDLRHLDKGPRNLIFMCACKGRAEVPTTLSPWYFKYRNEPDCKVWGQAFRQRIANQLPNIRDWTADVRSWEQVPIRSDAHYHVDPPFSIGAGRRYQHHTIDYEALGAWCRTIPSVQVCGRDDETWLNFDSIGGGNTTRGKRNGTQFNEGLWTSLALPFGQ